MGASQLVLIFIAELAFISLGSSACVGQPIETTDCEAKPDDSVTAASLLQRNSVTSTLGEAPTAAASPVPAVAAADGQDARPSLSLLQAFSSGSGTQRFSPAPGGGGAEAQPSLSLMEVEASWKSKPRRGQPNKGPTPMSLSASMIHKEQRYSTEVSSFFYLVPMGVSLMACCIILSLVWCFVSGERAEDENLSRVLGHIGGVANMGKLGGANQRPQVQSPKIRQEIEEPASTSGSAPSVPTSATASPAATNDEASEESAAEAPSADEAAGVATVQETEAASGVVAG